MGRNTKFAIHNKYEVHFSRHKTNFLSVRKLFCIAQHKFSSCEKLNELPNAYSARAEIFIRSPACFLLIKIFLHVAQVNFCSFKNFHKPPNTFSDNAKTFTLAPKHFP